MNDTFGRALNPIEKRNARYLDAITAFRTSTGLCMTQGAGEGGNSGGQSGDGQGAQQGQQQSGSGDTGGQQQGSGAKQQGQQQGGSDKGFPDGVPWQQMKPEEQARYWQYQSQRHEGRVNGLLAITGGKYGDDLKTIFDEYGQLKQASLTDGEKALEDARKQTRAEVAIDSVRSAFDLLLPDDMSAEQKEEKLGVLNLAAFLTTDGKVDTAKVRTHAATLAPAKDSGQQQHQQQSRTWGQGGRDSGGAPLGAGGAAEAARRFGTKSESTNS